MSFLITLTLTLLFIVVALLVFRFIGVPTYRIEPVNVERLLEAILEDRATVADWEIFTGLPIRQNPQLDKVRQRCIALAESEMIEKDNKVIFNQHGKNELRLILEELRDGQYT